MTHSESWNTFIDELRAYVLEHHHFPNKHTRLLSKVKYTRKKINDGTLEDWKKEQFLEVANMRDKEEHCGREEERLLSYLTEFTNITEYLLLIVTLI